MRRVRSLRSPVNKELFDCKYVDLVRRVSSVRKLVIEIMPNSVCRDLVRRVSRLRSPLNRKMIIYIHGGLVR